MNPAPDSTFWLHLLAWLAGEALLAIALAGVVAGVLRSHAWRRTVWQAAFVSLGLVLVAELTGVSRSLAPRLAIRPAPSPQFAVEGTLPTSTALHEQPGGASYTSPTFSRKLGRRMAPPSQLSMVGELDQSQNAALDEPAIAVPESVGLEEPTAAAVEPAAPRPPAHWWPGWLWLAGGFPLLARFAAARLLLLVASWRRRRVTDEALLLQVQSIRRRLGFGRRVRLLEFGGLRSPIAFGVLRPTIGLPARFTAMFSLAQQDAMLAHEVTHLAARDPLWHGVAEVVTAALWWHPLIWWARGRLHAASEAAADEASLVVDDGPSALAECLVDLGKRLDRRRALVWLGVEGGYRSGLGQRVHRLLQLNGAAWRPVHWTGKLVLLVSPCAIAAFTVALSAWAAPEDAARPSLAALLGQALTSVAQAGHPEKSAETTRDTPDSVVSNKLAAARLVLDGKLHYDLGNLDEAEVELRQAIQQDPDNQAAPHYLNLIAQARVRQAAEDNQPRPLIQIIPTNRAAQADLPQRPPARGETPTRGASLPPARSNAENPTAPTKRGEQPATSPIVQVWIDSQGSLRLEPNSPPVTLAELKAELTRRSPKPPAPCLAITADWNAPYDQILKVMRAVREADIPLGNLPTQQRVTGLATDSSASANPHVSSNKLHAVTLEHDGRLLWEMGKFDEAEVKLRQAIKEDPEDPDNRAAFYYLHRVQADRFRITDQKMLANLNRIRLPEVQFGGVELGAVLRSLSEEVRRHDPEEAGIRFIPTVERFDRIEDLMAVRVTINRPLTNVCLFDVLEAIVKGAERPIRYSGGNQAIQFFLSHQPTKSTPRGSTGGDSNVQSNKLNSAVLVQDGRLLWEMGKFDEAETKLRQVIKADPGNIAAAYYLALIEENRSSRATRTNSPPRPFLTNTGSGRQAIINKLNRIRLNETPKEWENLELGEVLRKLAEEARLRDDEKVGINFLIMAGAPPSAAAATTTIDPATGLPVPQGAPTTTEGQEDLSTSVRIKINPQLKNLRLADVLDVLTKTADKPIQYSIEDYGIVFWAKGKEPVPLYIRTYKVDPNTFVEGLERIAPRIFAPSSGSGGLGGFGGGGGVQQVMKGSGVIRGVTITNSIARVQQEVRDFFTANGVDFGPTTGKSLFFNERQGTLWARATLQDLDIIEAAIQKLNVVPPQVNLVVKFVDIPHNDSRALDFDWVVGNFLMGDARPYSPGDTALTNLVGTNHFRLSALTGILTDPQYRVVMHALEQRTGTDIQTACEVFTMSGRHAQAKATETRSLVPWSSQFAIERPLPVEVEIGPMLDAVPTVLADGVTIRLTLVPSVSELLADNLPPNGSGSGQSNALPVPHLRPSFRRLSYTTTLNVWDGQTVVLGGLLTGNAANRTTGAPLLGDLPLTGRLFRDDWSTHGTRNVLIFITPTIIDPAGNRVHTDADLPFAQKSIPPQPAQPPKK